MNSRNRPQPLHNKFLSFGILGEHLSHGTLRSGYRLERGLLEIDAGLDVE